MSGFVLMLRTKRFIESSVRARLEPRPISLLQRRDVARRQRGSRAERCHAPKLLGGNRTWRFARRKLRSELERSSIFPFAVRRDRKNSPAGVDDAPLSGHVLSTLSGGLGLFVRWDLHQCQKRSHPSDTTGTSPPKLSGTSE